MQGAITLQGRTQACYSQPPGQRRMQCTYRCTVQRAFRTDDSNTPTLSSSGDKSAAGSKQPTSATPHQPHPRSLGLVSSKPGRSTQSPTPSDQPFWKKPSFPFVATITAATLPYDLVVGRHRMAYTTRPQPTPHKTPATSHSPTSNSSSSVSSVDISSLNRHAKPAVQHHHTPVPDASVDSIAREAALAAGLRKPPTQPDTHMRPTDAKVLGLQDSRPARLNPERLAAEVQQAAKKAEAAATTAQSAAQKSSRASQTAADKQHAAGFGWGAAPGSGFGEPVASGFGVPSGPVDSWDSSDQAGMFSDDEAEQAAKAMVIELLTHPKDTEAALLHAAASQDGGSSGGRGLSVSPDYIDALVEAAREPSVGMPHHQPSPTVQDNASNSGNSSGVNSVSGDMPPKGWAAPSPPSLSQTPPATDPEPGQLAQSSDTQPRTRGHGSSRQGPTQGSSPSLWSWFEASPTSSQEEF